MKEVKGKKIFGYIFLVLFMTFTAVFIMVNLGYYEYSNYTKRVFTEEQIKKFEEDIKNGIALDINDYLIEEKTVDVNGQLGLKLSQIIGDISRITIEKIFELLNKVVET